MKQKTRRCKALNPAVVMTAKSPFLGPLRAVSFAGSTQYQVHCGVLAKYEKLDACYDRWRGCVNLADVPGSVGYTIIHFLYSGALEDCEGLDSSLQVYCVAQKYNIYDLAQLAKEQVDSFVLESPASRVLEIIQGASKSFTEGDRWLDELIQAQSCCVLEHELLQGQDSIKALLSGNDRVSRILIGELLLRCSRSAAATPADSTIGDESGFVQEYVSIDSTDTIEETQVVEHSAPEASCVPTIAVTSNNEAQEDVVNSAGVGTDEHPRPKQTKKQKQRALKAMREERKRKEEEQMKQEANRLRDAGCLCEGHRVFGCSYGWTNCDQCRTRIASIALGNSGT